MQKENNQCLACGGNGKLEKPCPKCKNGTLAPMTLQEKINARITPLRDSNGNYTDKRWEEVLYGCDECQHIEDDEGYPN